MQMINVLKRLAELDKDNPTISNPLAAGKKQFVEQDQLPQLPELKNLSELKALSGVKKIDECGPMGMMDSHPTTPASFSINASASNGDEVADMLSQIMNLAGVRRVGQEHMPMDLPSTAVISAPPMASANPSLGAIAAHGGNDGGSELMRAMMDKMNNPPEDEGYLSEPMTLTTDPEAPTPAPPPAPPGAPEDEGTLGTVGGGMVGSKLGSAAGTAIGGMVGGPLGALVGGGLGALGGAKVGGEIGNKITGEAEGEEADSSSPDVSNMADEVRDMADDLHNLSDEEKEAVVDGPEKEDMHPMRRMMDTVDNASYDNTPKNPNEVPPYTDRGYNSNDGSAAGRGLANNPRAKTTEELAQELFGEYTAFINEAKTCNDTPKGKKCPVHGMKECSMYEGSELKGGQKKLDVAEPKGKLTGADFKALKGKKKAKG